MKKVLLAILSLLFIQATCSHAVTPPPPDISPGAIRERSKETMEYYKLEKRVKERVAPKPGEEGITDETAKPDQPAPAIEEKVIFINKILVNRSEILTIDEVETIITPYEGSEASIQELFDIVEAINALYREKGYITARAILPQQQVGGGIVTIRLVEAHLGKIVVEGTDNTKDSFIRKRISVQPGELITLSGLESDLLYFNTINDVQIRAVLKPGKAAGTTDYILKVKEPKKYEALVFVDNAGRRDVGEYRTGVSLTNNTLLGYRDRLSIGGYLADGTKGGYGSYLFPVNRSGTRLGISFEGSTIEIKKGTLASLDITGESTDLGIFLTHPMTVTQNLTINGFAGINSKKSTTDFSDVELFRTDVKSFNLGFDHQLTGKKGVWYSRHHITVGLDEFGGDNNFLTYNGEISRLHRLRGGHVCAPAGQGAVE